jgi:hypothetical protein
VLGLFGGGALLGMVGVARAAEVKRRHRCRIWGMYVTPAARGSGAGRALLDAALAQARAWPGIAGVELAVSEAAASARRLYGAAGFRAWGREPRALRWQGRFADELHLALELDVENLDLDRARAPAGASAAGPAEPTATDRADRILARVARALGEGDALDGLVRRLPPSDLQSLLLHVFRQRSATRTPAELLAQHAGSRTLEPSAVEARLLLEVARAAFACAPAFEALELAPVAPLGTNRVLGSVDQNNCLATVRGVEVLADPTTAQALECARRRRGGARGTIRLCSASRALRLQPIDVPWFTPHFALFSMVSAGRDRGGLAFEMESLREHLGAYVALLRRLDGEGYAFPEIDVAVSHTRRDGRALDQARAEVLDPLGAAWPGVAWRIDLEREQGRHYYDGLCLRIDATNGEGARHNLADGGFTDWTRRLLSNAKERLLVSGIGSELVPKCFRRDPHRRA